MLERETISTDPVGKADSGGVSTLQPGRAAAWERRGGSRPPRNPIPFAGHCRHGGESPIFGLQPPLAPRARAAATSRRGPEAECLGRSGFSLLSAESHWRPALLLSPAASKAALRILLSVAAAARVADRRAAFVGAALPSWRPEPPEAGLAKPLLPRSDFSTGSLLSWHSSPDPVTNRIRISDEAVGSRWK